MKVIKYVLMFMAFSLVTQVGAQDKDKIAKKFKRVDKDGNKLITKEEWKSFYAEKKTKDGKPVKYEFTFLGFDKDGDGKITLEEMQSGMDKKLAKKRMKS